MSNLKKILALVLALVMSFSLVTVSSAALTDAADIDEAYAEAAEVLMALDIVKGDNGKFNPKDDITRAQVAALIYRIHTGDVKDERAAYYADAARFTDEIPAWAKGYVGYCAANGLIKGYADGSFQANGKVTGFEALTMILRAIGYGQLNEFTGINWSTNAASRATQLGITDNVKPGALVGPATREVVAEILFRAMITNQANYTPALGYVESTIIDARPSLGWENFDLFEFENVIDAVDYNKGYTYIEGARIANTDGNWENIGYNAHVWAVCNVGSKTFTAVSEVEIIGKVLYTSNDDTTFDEILKDDLVEVATDATYYVNGYVTTKATAEKLIGKVGVNVDFVDNDYVYYYNGGLADAVIVTDYTAATVTGVANATNTGFNAYVPETYYFNYNSKGVEAKDVICATELAYGDVVTYVIYDNQYYVTVAPSVEDTFNKINYNRTTRSVESYLIGDVAYMVSHEFLGDKDLLAQKLIGEDRIVYTDPYGHMLKVTDVFTTDNYLYVVRTNHSNNVLGTTFATVCFADGTLANVDVSKANAEYFTSVTPDMYTFTEAEGLYKLGVDCDDKDDVMFEYALDFKAGNPTLKTNEAYFSNSTVVIDLRDVIGKRATEAKVLESYKDIPTLNGAKFHCVVDPLTNFVVLAFLTDGTAPAASTDLTNAFMVYHTDAHYWNGNYYMDVIKGGELKEIKLTEAEYADICALGVGTYQYSKAGVLTYKSFMQDWEEATWLDGTIVVDGKGYSYADDEILFVLDIAEGKVYNYEMILGRDTYAIVKTSSYSATEIYVIYGDVTNTTDGTKAVDADGEAYVMSADGNKYNYYMEPGFVTYADVVEEIAENDVDVAIKAVEDAIAALEKLLKDNGLKLAAVKVDASYRDLAAAIEEAYDAIDDAMDELEELINAEDSEATDAQINEALALNYKVDVTLPKQLEKVYETNAVNAVKAALADVLAAIESEDADDYAAAVVNAAMANELFEEYATEETLTDVIDDPDALGAFLTAADAGTEDDGSIPDEPNTPEQDEEEELRAAAKEAVKAAIAAAIKADENAKLIGSLSKAVADTTTSFKVTEDGDATKMPTLYTAWTETNLNAVNETATLTLAEALDKYVEDLEETIEAAVKAYGAALKVVAAESEAAKYVTATFGKADAAPAGTAFDTEKNILTVPAGVTVDKDNYATYLKVTTTYAVESVTVKGNTISVKVKDNAEVKLTKTFAITWKNETVTIDVTGAKNLGTDATIALNGATTGTITINNEIGTSVKLFTTNDGVDTNDLLTATAGSATVTQTYTIDGVEVDTITAAHTGKTLTVTLTATVEVDEKDVEVAEVVYTFVIGLAK